jgi:hypothetical protein
MAFASKLIGNCVDGDHPSVILDLSAIVLLPADDLVNNDLAVDLVIVEHALMVHVHPELPY